MWVYTKKLQFTEFVPDITSFELKNKTKQLETKQTTNEQIKLIIKMNTIIRHSLEQDFIYATQSLLQNSSKSITVDRVLTVYNSSIIDTDTMHHFNLLVSNHAPWFDHNFINCLASYFLFCPIHKKLVIWE